MNSGWLCQIQIASRQRASEVFGTSKLTIAIALIDSICESSQGTTLRILRNVERVTKVFHIIRDTCDHKPRNVGCRNMYCPQQKNKSVQIDLHSALEDRTIQGPWLSRIFDCITRYRGVFSPTEMFDKPSYHRQQPRQDVRSFKLPTEDTT